MTHNTLTPQKIFFTIGIFFLIGYGVFNSRFLIKGPEVAIAGLDPKEEVIETTERDFSLRGTAIHSSFITVNNRPILVDESGNFDEKLLLSNGISIIDIYARDKFGKEVRKKIDVVYTGESDSPTTQYDEIALRAQIASSTQEESQTNTDTALLSSTTQSSTTATSSGF